MGEERVRILVVDDSPEDREAFRRALTGGDAAFDVAEACTGAEGLEDCRTASPGCVILDHRLPDMDALAFLEALKGGRAEPLVPVVVVTGQGDESLAMRAMRAGAHDSLVKGAAGTDVRRAVRAAIERHARAPDRTYRVLIVDDSPEDRAAYRRRLTQGSERFECEEAETGADGVARCRSFRPDCVLLDYQLPDTDGIEVLTALARDLADGSFAVVMLTGRGSEAVAVRALKAGAEDYLVKGPALETLPQAVRSAVEKVSLRRRIEEQRVELERSRNQLGVTLASIGDAVITTDSEGNVTFLNAVAVRLTGWGTEEARGRPLAEVFAIVNQDTRKPVENPALRALREGTIVGLANHTVLLAKDGTEWPIDDSAAPIRDEAGRVYGSVLVFREVTERRRAEEALREADRKKDDFIALLAHELRNPLAPIRNGLEVIRLAGGLSDPAARARDRMDRQLTHLVRLVDDLLDVSRITRGKMELRRSRVRLADVVGSAVETARPLVDAAGHELTVDLPAEPVVLDADLTRLAQVFANLLTNSAKYTPAGGRIWLTVARGAGEVGVTVRDTGIGIPAEALPTIFDMFSQVDRSIEKETGGLGIGLALVKGLTEMHGGAVAVESPGPGRGTTFTVRLPVAGDRPGVPAPPATESERAEAGRRVLVVDDNRDGAESLAEMLRLLGHEVHVAHDGLEAVEAAGRVRPELVLMDVGMPSLNGLDATRRIREQPWGRGMTVIALTGWGQEGDRERSREAGCDGHLVKPVGLAELHRLLARLPGVQDDGTRPEK